MVVEPLEKTDPELSKLFLDIVHGKLPFKIKKERVYNKNTGKELFVKVPGRNEPCSCDSGLKYKKCCLNR